MRRLGEADQLLLLDQLKVNKSHALGVMLTR
jgi:hypothetical protein